MDLLVEATPTLSQLQDLPEAVARLKSTAPGLEFTFRVVITAEGEKPAADQRAKLDRWLAEVKSGWKFEP